MTLALWCLLAACFLPVLCAGLAKWGFRDYDNNAPREWLARQTGWRARANAAQANSFEALPLFVSAVLVAHWLRAPQPMVDALAVAWVALRVAYVGCYVADLATLRSLCWLGAVVAAVWMFVLGA